MRCFRSFRASAICWRCSGRTRLAAPLYQPARRQAGPLAGFPIDILRELFALRAYYDELHPGSNRPWEVMNNSE
jgi:hypothetical protein